MEPNFEIQQNEYNTILLAEDDPNDILLIKRAFRKANINNPIQVVENGEDAIAYIAGKGRFFDRMKYPLPALIILDLKLPRSSGHEVLKWRMKKKSMKRIPVVVFTSSNRIADINQAYELGANSYMIKPVSYTSLIKIVRAVYDYWFFYNKMTNQNFLEEINEKIENTPY